MSAGWMAAMMAAASRRPEVEVRLARLEVLPGPEQRSCGIDLIRIEPGPMRGQGLASAALKDLCREADRHGVLLHLTPDPVPRSRGLRKAQLLAWYVRRGFRPNTGHRKELRVMDTLIREPVPRDI